MKLTILFLTAVYLHVSAAGYGQKVTISGKDLPLEKVFSVIKKQTDYVCFYGYDILKDAKPVSLNFKDADVEEVLKAALWIQGLDFSITGKTITIVKKPVTTAVAGPGRTVQANGTVYNEAGQPLSGANITIKTTGKGTITNAKGEFELPAVPENSPLVISFIGYAPQEVKISEGKAIQVFLNVAKNELDKVVVQAYGSTTQRLNTGNIATVTKEQLERHPVMNILQALQGQVAGVIVQQTSGYASAPFKVEIRGRSVINPDLPSDPLYIIDGVPLTVLNLDGTQSGDYEHGSAGFNQNGFGGPAGGQSPLFSINPADIESITVLKDADATAIYGSRGANGVIILTTKKGKPGKAKFDLNIYSGFSKVTSHYSVLNRQQYLSMRQEALKNDNLIPDAGNAYDLVLWDTTKSTDWQKIAFGAIGKSTEVESSLSGGDKFNTYRLSAGYHHETSILNFSGADQRGSVQFNLNHKSLNEKLNISFTSFYSYSQSNLITLGASALLPPVAPSEIFDKQGHLNYAAWQPVSNLFPFANILQPYTGKTTFLNSQLTFGYEVIRGLNFSTNLGYSTNNGSQIQIFPIASQDPTTNPLGYSMFGNNNGSRYILEPQLEYKTNISKGRISVLIGASSASTSQSGNTILGTGYINDALLGSVSNAPSKNANDFSGQYKYAAVFGRLNYNWKDKYILNLSARRDGSSRFGPGKQYGNFGAIGAAWIFSEEEWFNHMSFLSFGKLRASYGITGSDQIGDYQYLTHWSAGNVIPYQPGVPAYIPLILSNPDLRWQANKKLEVGLSLGFLKDRIQIEPSYYRNRCGNQLVPFPLSTITGFSSVYANSPANVQNSGWEIIVKTKIIDNKDLRLSLSINAGRNYNKLLSYPNFSQSPYAGRFVIGQPLNIVRTLQFTGVDPLTGNYAYKDLNKDGTISTDNYPTGDLYFKEMNILLDGGSEINLQYKGLQLNLFFTGRWNPFLPSAIYNSFPGTIGNQSTQVLNRWKAPGDHATFARFTENGNQSDALFAFSDGVYSNGSYIRLRNLSLSYDMPSKLIGQYGIQNCRVYLRGENLFVISKYNGIDPETPGLGALPPAKIFTVGVQVGF